MLDFECPASAESATYHEAGHAVTGLALGFHIDELLVREDCTGHTAIRRPLTEPKLSLWQRHLMMLTAGPLAEVLFLELELECYEECDRRSGKECLFRLVRHRIRNVADEEKGSDTRKAFAFARDIILVRNQTLRLKWHQAKYFDDIIASNRQTPPTITTEEVLAEIIPAERWAERLLRRLWPAVKAVALALETSPEGKLTGEEVKALAAAARGPTVQ